MDFYKIVAGSGFGNRQAIYKSVEGVLVLRHEGNHDNLAGNGTVCNFEGYTLDQANEKISAIMSEPVGHSYDGCHACDWSISIQKMSDVPFHLTYNDPNEVFAIREALQIFRRKL